MPYDDPDPSDPHELVGVMIPADREATREMAYVFAEEFARLGYSRDRILRLFSHPFYAGAHRAYRELGAKAISEIVGECIAVWGCVRSADRDDTSGPSSKRS